jgi:hypothetical protein
MAALSIASMASAENPTWVNLEASRTSDSLRNSACLLFYKLSIECDYYKLTKEEVRHTNSGRNKCKSASTALTLSLQIIQDEGNT